MRADVVLSLDFELRWGVQDVLGENFDTYRRNLEGVRDAVPAMLEVFEKRGVRATWAIVGAIACEGWDEWLARAPAWPRYLDADLRWRDAYRRGDPKGRLYFAPDLVDQVRCTSGQELGSHTFSHAYMGEPGFVRRDAIADGTSVAELFREKWGTRPTSFVFPRNQIAFVDVLEEHGVNIWRANPDQLHWSLTPAAQGLGIVRLMRLADGLLPLGTRTHLRDASMHRASHFVRFNLPSLAWRAHLKRLVAEASRLRPDEQLHLWWHPHNLGYDPAESIERLATLLDSIRDRAPAYTRFANMSDVAPERRATAAQ